MRRWLAPLLAVLVMAASAGPALALLVWTLNVTPGTARSGTETTFTLTATNLDALTELGCLEVDLPISFTLLGASAGVASNGDEWEAVLFPNKVAVHSLSGGGRLELGQSITFTIVVRPTQPGASTWANHAHPDQDCGGAEEIGVGLAVLVLPGNQSTPSPVPTLPTPTPTPTPPPILPVDPLPSILPVDPLPSILPPLPSTRLPTPLPTARSTASPTPTASPDASPTPDSSDSGSTSPTPRIPTAEPGGAAGGPAGSDGPDRGALQLAGAEPDQPSGSAAEVSLGPLGVIDGLNVWAIPGAIVGGPGLLVILWVAFQTGVALAWIPAVRRMRGKDGSRPGAYSGPRRTVAG
ncbi:MAG: hypothetical protein ACXWWQ_07055 [Candidatus Limnocylindria bacterium]